MYGQRLFRDFGESVPDEWISAIANLKDFQIKRGFVMLGASGSGSVPTLPQFLKACRTTGDEDRSAIVPERTLPGPDYDRAHCIGQLAMLSFVMRSTLEGDGAATPESLDAMVKEKNRIVEQYRQILPEDPDASKEMPDVIRAALKKYYVPKKPGDPLYPMERKFV
jgi:hypothetical protein